jgi:hypothetical protein
MDMAKKGKTYIAFLGKRGEKWYEESAVVKAKNIKSARKKLEKRMSKIKRYGNKNIKKMKQYKPKRRK